MDRARPHFVHGDTIVNRTDLNRAVARATGETVDVIDRLGFQLIFVPVPAPPRVRRRARRRPRTAASRDSRAGQPLVV